VYCSVGPATALPLSSKATQLAVSGPSSSSAIAATLNINATAPMTSAAYRMALCLIASTLRLKRSIGAFEQTPRDDLRLDFCRALENIQDACIAKHAADRILARYASAAHNIAC